MNVTIQSEAKRKAGRISDFVAWVLIFDAGCIVFALIATVLGAIRFAGHFGFPVWIQAPWLVICVLLSLIALGRLLQFTNAVNELFMIPLIAGFIAVPTCIFGIIGITSPDDNIVSLASRINC